MKSSFDVFRFRFQWKFEIFISSFSWKYPLIQSNVAFSFHFLSLFFLCQFRSLLKLYFIYVRIAYVYKIYYIFGYVLKDGQYYTVIREFCFLSDKLNYNFPVVTFDLMIQLCVLSICVFAFCFLYSENKKEKIKFGHFVISKFRVNENRIMIKKQTIRK